ncbi:MAG: DegT/DnrJ/EryC1/StrS aminotransferase family protein [Rhodospirillales bacterium]|nr:DegT/DnrJ/EryC1/StrS aminotransferase family protein [Rhodospirillales bacterium]
MDDKPARPFLPFARPSIDEAEIAEVVACLKSGWLATGPRVQKFEAALAEYFGGPRVLAVTSATAGLHLALLALGLKPGDEVITTPLTFVATLNTIVQAGGRPVLADVEPDTFNLDVGRVAKAITPRTRAIVPVHFAGLPVDLDPLYDLARAKNLRVIEDCAHAIGAEYKGRRLGAFGDIQVFSFHPNKNMTTGEGGAVVTRDADVARAVSTMRFHGIDREAFNRFSKAGSQEYDVVAPGYKYNMMDLQAALGLHQLAKVDGFNARRGALAARYQKLFAGWRQIELPQPATFPHRHAWHLFTALIDDKTTGLARDEFIAAMKEQDIGVGLHYTAAHLFAYYRREFGFKPGDFPEAERICARICSLPLFPDMTEADQDRVVGAMAVVLGRANA